MTETSLEDRIDQLESRADISALVARYCYGVDRRDTETFLSIWHEDAKYLIGAGRGDFYGRDDIARFMDVVAKVWRETYHWTTNHTTTFSGRDSASGLSEAFAMCGDHEGKVCFVAARYTDEYSRRDGVWKISSREVHRWFVSPGQDIPLLPPQ
jgi:uncharacterized protein (TIGR02246 family)